jgi:hydroxyethylthiazole kinase
MVWRDVERIRAEVPLVHSITNYVVMNSTANALLAAGASPVMAHAVEEVEEMVAHARALVVNIGTLSAPWVEAMVRAGLEARRLGIPAVLDPVGCGATRWRLATAQRLIAEIAPAVIRGNASEIRALVREDRAAHGVDSAHDTEDAVDDAQALAARCGCVVSVSGATDVVASASAVIRIRNGHPWMRRVTGMGCTATALTAAFVAVNPLPVRAAAHAMGLMGIAGEIAATRSSGPGTFQPAFLDALHLMKEGDIRDRLLLEQG